MITREEYIAALDIVEKYHLQLSMQRVIATRRKKWDDLDVGDKIIFEKSLSKKVIIGKEYQIIELVNWDANPDRTWAKMVSIIDESGKVKTIGRYRQGSIIKIASQP